LCNKTDFLVKDRRNEYLKRKVVGEKLKVMNNKIHKTYKNK